MITDLCSGGAASPGLPARTYPLMRACVRAEAEAACMFGGGVDAIAAAAAPFGKLPDAAAPLPREHNEGRKGLRW